MSHASSIGVVRARPARAALHAAVGWLTCLLPVAVAHAPTFWAWSALAAAACATVGAMQAGPPMRTGISPIVGVAALSVALLADFVPTYPEAVLALCSSASFVDDWVLHVRLFPFTAAAMVGLSIAGVRGERWRQTRWPKRVADVAVALGAMMFAMNLSAMLLRAWAGLVGWPWGANALVCSMLVGMMLDHAAKQAMADAIAAARASHAID
ncbi:hypothetical protein [Burkholderia thailandensis]|uniref:hypothetical protein n=1 Tax=Burkholderia thailandensis TaxID=57975 RepID=UPI0003EC8A39|nr:hypothetical protein [Burkholderia thailandensis]AHI82443.1 putative membrane protein [Burkholderia thailandensis E444]AWY65945.1 hypothetical protein A8H36_12895 [Burkholderia thailandensis]KVG10540.1 hypothetical protein WJ25_10395 [Burkholderia thailandensis]MCS3396486.1 hypothetical protein [Burkholderia thailandensis]MCS6476504.1 hypothetical protein [Burkholderia thailandensis]